MLSVIKKSRATNEARMLEKPSKINTCHRMSQHREPPGTAYASFDAVELRGPDAGAFLQAQLASDVAALADGACGWSCYLTPQGRTIAVFVVSKHAADAIDLLVPAARGAEMVERLKRFVFRSKVKLAAVEAAYAAMPGVEGDVLLDDGLVLVRGGVPDETFLREWAIRNAVPLLAGDAIESQTPHALGLDGIGAISTKKGCYPGQEIVARTHFLGRNKRHLVRWRAESPVDLAPGAALHTADGAIAAMNVIGTPAEGPVGGLAVAHEQAVQGSRWVGPAGTPVTFELVGNRAVGRGEKT